MTGATKKEPTNPHASQTRQGLPILPPGQLPREITHEKIKQLHRRPRQGTKQRNRAL